MFLFIAGLQVTAEVTPTAAYATNLWKLADISIQNSWLTLVTGCFLRQNTVRCAQSNCLRSCPPAIKFLTEAGGGGF